MADREISDAVAMDLIHHVMDGTEWSPDTLEEIAEIVQRTGREIHYG